MTLYYIIAILCLLSLFFNEKIGKVIGWGTLLLMACMTMFRGDLVGTDTLNYLSYNKDYRIEEFFITGLVGLIDTGTISERGIIYATCIVTYVFAFLNIKRYRIDVRYFCVYFFILGFFAMSMNISRQIASVSIVSFFLPNIFAEKRKQSLLFILGCILAAGFHISSLYLIYLYGLRYIHLKRSNSQITMFLLGVMILFDILPIDYFLNKFMPETYSNSYVSVVSQDLQVSLIGYIYRVILLGIAVYNYKYLSNRKDVWLFVFSTIIINAAIGMDSNVARIFNINSYILLIFNCLVYTTSNLKRDKVLKLLFWIQLLMGLYMTLSSFNGNPDLRSFEFIKI